MNANVGDLVRLTISGTDAVTTRATLEDIIPALAPDIAPVDEGARPVEHFDLYSLAMDFVVAATAGLSAEGIRALIVSSFRRRGAQESTAGTEDAPDHQDSRDLPQVSVRTTTDGVVEITIQIR